MVHSCITVEYISLQSFRTVYERLGARKLIFRKSWDFEGNPSFSQKMEKGGGWAVLVVSAAWQLVDNGLYAPYLPPGRSPDRWVTYPAGRSRTGLIFLPINLLKN